jgi:hypothetical protein
MFVILLLIRVHFHNAHSLERITNGSFKLEKFSNKTIRSFAKKKQFMLR